MRKIWIILLIYLVSAISLAGCDNVTKPPEGEGNEKKEADTESGDDIGYENKASDNRTEYPLEKELAGDWVFPNGARISIEQDGTYMLYDDTDNWRFGGTSETEEGSDSVKVKLYSEVGDAGNNQVASGMLHYDDTGYLVLELEFVPYLTEFTDGKAALSKKR